MKVQETERKVHEIRFVNQCTVYEGERRKLRIHQKVLLDYSLEKLEVEYFAANDMVLITHCCW